MVDEEFRTEKLEISSTMGGGLDVKDDSSESLFRRETVGGIDDIDINGVDQVDKNPENTGFDVKPEGETFKCTKDTDQVEATIGTMEKNVIRCDGSKEDV